MHFVDECLFTVQAGKGGDGAIAFRREKCVPFGGPAGGDGGKGGDVIFEGDEGKNTLRDLAHRRVLAAKNGENGSGQDKYGRSGTDLVVGVPLGTIVFDQQSGERVAEVTAAGQRVVIAAGGKGGRGNIHFATPTDRAPKRAEPGTPGRQLDVRLELKVMADVGLLGFPNVGKSTFINNVSRSRSKIADYPFTTLEPHLGVVVMGDSSSGLSRSFVVADIPGLVPGAAEGHGLGSRFLRHVERTRVLLHLVTLSEEPDRDPLTDYRALRIELEKFNPELAARPELVALSKVDLPDVSETYEQWRVRFQEEEGVSLLRLSAPTREGLTEVLERVTRALDAKNN